MARSQAIRLVPEPARSLAFGSIGAAYAAVGTAFQNPIRIVRIQNLTDAALWFSFDGIYDHEVISPNAFLLLDVTANASREQGCFFAEGTRMYVKELDTPTTGSVYVTVYHGETL